MKIKHEVVLFPVNNRKRFFASFSQRERVQIALYFAEDCLNFVAAPIHKKCIELVKSWLVGENIKNEELETAVDGAEEYYRQNDFNIFSYIFAYAVLAVMFDDGYYVASAFEDMWKTDSFRHKRKEYFSLIRGFKSEIDEKDVFFESINFSEKDDVLVFFDYLTEHYPDHNVFCKNKLNTPDKYRIKGNSLHQLADKIVSSKYANVYLTKLFKE